MVPTERFALEDNMCKPVSDARQKCSAVDPRGKEASHMALCMAF